MSDLAFPDMRWLDTKQLRRHVAFLEYPPGLKPSSFSGANGASAHKHGHRQNEVSRTPFAGGSRAIPGKVRVADYPGVIALQFESKCRVRPLLRIEGCTDKLEQDPPLGSVNTTRLLAGDLRYVFCTQGLGNPTIIVSIDSQGLSPIGLDTCDLPRPLNQKRAISQVKTSGRSVAIRRGSQEGLEDHRTDR